MAVKRERSEREKAEDLMSVIMGEHKYLEDLNPLTWIVVRLVFDLWLARWYSYRRVEAEVAGKEVGW